MRVEGKRAPRAMPCLLRHAMLATRLASCCTRGLGHVPGYRWDLQRAVQAPRAMPMLCSCSSSSAVATVAAPAAAAVSTASASMSPMLFRQLFDTESSTYTYLLADSDTKEALLIDPVVEHVARDAQLVQDLGLTLILAVNTHVHADHVTGTGELKKRFPHLKSGISAAADAKADVLFKPQEEFSIGQHTFKVLPTPGHTLGCVSYYTASGGGMVFTGDALLVRGCGRTDFQGGSSETLYGSVHGQLFTLPASTLVYPAHDYKGFTCSSIDEEKHLNPRLTKTLQEFVGIMANLNLPKPKKIDVAVPLNLVCGVQE